MAKSKKLILRCPECGEEAVTVSPCPFTGWAYSDGWVVVCPRCKAHMTPRPDETPKHTTECEKVLVENDVKR
jgi:hypothetical protein